MAYSYRGGFGGTLRASFCCCACQKKPIKSERHRLARILPRSALAFFFDICIMAGTVWEVAKSTTGANAISTGAVNFDTLHIDLCAISFDCV